jgi:hypothetical protein
VKEPKYKHFFVVKDGKFVWEDGEMFDYKKRSLEGKKGYALIEEQENKPSPNQYAYYFAGIIRKECMVSDCFQGLSEKQIHSILFLELRSSVHGIKMPDGSTRLKTIAEDFNRYTMKDMAKYIEELIPYLNTEYNIWPKPADHYKYNKFYMNPKIIT